MGIFEIVFLFLACTVVVEFAVLIRVLWPVKPAKLVEPAKIWIRVCDQPPVLVCSSVIEKLEKSGMLFELEPRKGN